LQGFDLQCQIYNNKKCKQTHNKPRQQQTITTNKLTNQQNQQNQQNNQPTKQPTNNTTNQQPTYQQL